MMTCDPRPIGIFDSGVGGLTVLRAMLHRFPDESFIYLGDTARVPYGTKSARTVERYTIQVADYLIQRGVKGVVAACNTASALGLPALRAHTALPVMGVIRPGCLAAMAVTRKGRIGVIGTRSTIASGAYLQVLGGLDPQAEVVSLACPLFVPLVEEGWLHHPATRMIVQESLTPLLSNPPDVLILGCTHYPLLKSIIGEVVGPEVHLVDSAAAMAEELAERLGEEIAPAPAGHGRSLEFLVTDVVDRFREVANRFLDDLPMMPMIQVEMIDLV